MSLDLIDGIKWYSPTVWLLLHARIRRKKNEKKIVSLVYRIHFSLDKKKGKKKWERKERMRWIVATHTTRSSHTLIVQKWNIILTNQNSRKENSRRWTILNKRYSQTVRKGLIRMFFSKLYIKRSMVNPECLLK